MKEWEAVSGLNRGELARQCRTIGYDHLLGELAGGMKQVGKSAKKAGGSAKKSATKAVAKAKKTVKKARRWHVHTARPSR